MWLTWAVISPITTVTEKWQKDNFISRRCKWKAQDLNSLHSDQHLTAPRQSYTPVNIHTDESTPSSPAKIQNNQTWHILQQLHAELKNVEAEDDKH